MTILLIALAIGQLAAYLLSFPVAHLFARTPVSVTFTKP